MKTVSFKVKKSNTIKDLKALVNEKEGIPEKFQVLFCDGNLLMDGERLVDCCVRGGSSLLVVQNCAPLKLFIKLSSNARIIVLEATAGDTVRNIKYMIVGKEGIQADGFTLVYDGNLLEDDRTLSSLDIRSESTIDLIFNPKEVISVHVKIPAGKILHLSVKLMFTICDIKSVIGSMIGVPVNDWRLFYGGKQLEDSKTIAFYNIQEGSFLQLKWPLFLIFVRFASGEPLTLQLHQHTTVRRVKIKVSEHKKMAVNDVRLIFGGGELRDEQDLASCNITNHSTIYAMTHLREGCNRTDEPTENACPTKGISFKELALHDEQIWDVL